MNQAGVSNPANSIFMSGKYCCMVMRINVDCNACCRKLRKIILNLRAIESHLIEKQECRVSVCGTFRPSDVAIKIRKKMNRRVQILEIQELDATTTEQIDHNPMVPS
ncbi:heavy metal-associated isoprenylated plant protein 9 [Castanea sativa]|uniref:heavy metal-associated isoprenylated plant protein 9 n=1 Tax=Castanea sativa TaxID=21020 RepID=UPI003F651C3E